MAVVDQYFAEYGTYHTDRRNLICHEIGIPLIVLSLFALLELLRFGPIDLAMVVGLAVIIYYATLDLRLALVALLAFAVLYLIGRFIWWPVAVALFVVGWIFQFVGHGYEGKRPAFLHNLVHLLIGPLWIISLAFPRAKS
jgi:uncharacterized membrane protein YGL010W